MSIAYGVVAVVLAGLLLASAASKLARPTSVVEFYTGIGVPLGMLPFLAACEIAGAAGLVAGIWYPPLGIAAAIGLVLYFLGAIGAHLRKSDFKGLPSPGVMLVAAGAALVLGVVSA
jgi:DoxX-like family